MLRLITQNITKDTLEYFFVICNKTEWMREAINLNILNHLTLFG